jgi:hypothetical protein
LFFPEWITGTSRKRSHAFETCLGTRMELLPDALTGFFIVEIFASFLKTRNNEVVLN